MCSLFQIPKQLQNKLFFSIPQNLGNTWTLVSLSRIVWLSLIRNLVSKSRCFLRVQKVLFQLTFWRNIILILIRGKYWFKFDPLGLLWRFLSVLTDQLNKYIQIVNTWDLWQNNMNAICLFVDEFVYFSMFLLFEIAEWYTEFFTRVCSIET